MSSEKHRDAPDQNLQFLAVHFELQECSVASNLCVPLCDNGGIQYRLIVVPSNPKSKTKQKNVLNK